MLFNSLLQDSAAGQDKCLLPLHEGECFRYDTYIEMSQAYISGICILLYDEHVIKGSPQYINKRRNITYNFKPVDNAITQ